MIKLENISKYYYSSNAVVPALKKIQLEFNIGEFVSIIGESGSGKTTLLNIISGLDTYDDGELYYNGKPTSHFDAQDWEEYRKNKIGFVFANNNLIDNYSALQNVESSLLIQGIDVHRAKQMALDILKKVGMGDFTNQKVARLSSGQRQRLTIARALAKNTDIIIADEPTANLDSETGKQIIELLSKISKNKLILLVTHDYEEVESYVTRKIRIQDGQVVLDVSVGKSDSMELISEQILKPVSEPASEPVSEPISEPVSEPISEPASEPISEPISEQILEPVSASLPAPTSEITSEITSEWAKIVSEGKNKKTVKSSGSIARRFAFMNLTTQYSKTAFIFTFMLLVAIISFLSFGIIYSNLDDIKTKRYDNSVFYHEDINRIAVRHSDGAEITAADMNFFQSAAHVKIADMYDYANDINYYCKFDTDYKYTYSMNYNNKGELADVRLVDFLNEDHFMKSATCLSEDNLSEGSLPTGLFEIAVYCENSDILGTTLDCYFTAENIWGNKQHYYAKCKVTGILKDDSDQIFFSGKLCSMLTVRLSNNEYIVKYDSNGEGAGFKGSLAAIPVIGEGLEYNQIRTTKEQLITTTLHPIGKAEFCVNLYDEYGTSYQSSNYDAEIIPDFNENNTGEFFELNERFFDELFPQSSNQASLYIDDYVYMDNVLSELKNQGYEAISTYRTASIKYISEKVSSRLTFISICTFILLLLGIFEILIIRSFLRIKSRNFEVLKAMGMNYKTAKKITYYELPIYALVASIIVICTAISVRTFGGGKFYLVDLLKYFKMDSYITYVAYNILLTIMTAFVFNIYLRRKIRRSLYDKN